MDRITPDQVVKKLSELTPLPPEFDQLVLHVEEQENIVVDYVVTETPTGYEIVFDDKDRTYGLESEQFKDKAEMLAYFEKGLRQPMVLDSVDT